eukprot:gnl/MRDRNA2_/MRDRNA2_172330_c0_seq1.p1 gnl/MRDRNA2_/MRDRNA2_172330_c0~~gnl/MRDRNA2_/MRDRNA2_172330_c0_seq1.p1  ORF type:complete len:269 (+),score=73.39 gnl/MRDRNA2_/MRDRNA2_172330_c0_seq1:125-931(+)
MRFESKISWHLLLSSFIFTIFAAYLGQSRRERVTHVTANQVSSDDLAIRVHRANKLVSVGGRCIGEPHPFVGRIGELIASKGFDLITSGQGGNMDLVREAFSKKKKDGQKSIWAPSQWDLDIKISKEKAGKDGTPPNVDETLDPDDMDGDLKSWIAKVDMLVVVPGGKGVAMEVEMARKENKPCFGVLFQADSMSDDGKTPTNSPVKEALMTNGFDFVEDMDWEKDSKEIENFLDGKSADGKVKSSTWNIFPSSVSAILMGGLFAASQ